LRVAWGSSVGVAPAVGGCSTSTLSHLLLASPTPPPSPPTLPSSHPQVVGYALALYGLSMYHKFKAGMHDVPFIKLAKDAATDKVMMVMAAGLVLLLFVAQ
jgi:hypothetical protein